MRPIFRRAPGVAIREFPLKPGHGFADYLLFVRGHAVGVLEAKKAGTTLSGVEAQSRKYSEGLPDTPVKPLPFCYLSTGAETRFANHLDPHPRSRRIFQFHRPETLDVRHLAVEIAEDLESALEQIKDILGDFEERTKPANVPAG